MNFYEQHHVQNMNLWVQIPSNSYESVSSYNDTLDLLVSVCLLCHCGHADISM